MCSFSDGFAFQVKSSEKNVKKRKKDVMKTDPLTCSLKMSICDMFMFMFVLYGERVPEKYLHGKLNSIRRDHSTDLEEYC